MIWSIICFISVFIIVFLIMEISPMFFPIIEKKLGVDLYYGGDVFYQKSFSIKGNSLLLIFTMGGVIIFLFIMNLIFKIDDFFYLFMTVQCIYVILFAVILYIRSDVFVVEPPDEFKPTTLKDGTVEWGAVDYHFGHYGAIYMVISGVFTSYGTLILMQGHMNILVLIGFPLQILVMFPDKLNKIWPIDIKSDKGFTLLYLSIVALILICGFLVIHFTSMGVNLFDISF